MKTYELYVCCWGPNQCHTLSTFEAESDEEARSIAYKKMEEHDAAEGNHIYREYLWLVREDGKPKGIGEHEVIL